jgi:hypothetical protein
MLVQVIYLSLENFLLIVYLHDGAIDFDSCHCSSERLSIEKVVNLSTDAIHILFIIIIIIKCISDKVVNHVPFSFGKELLHFSGLVGVHTIGTL